jgi:hypothetical protein
MNPAVTLASAATRAFPWREVPAYVAAQIGGAFAGVAVAHGMFGERALFFASGHARSGAAQMLAELVARRSASSPSYGAARAIVRTRSRSPSPRTSSARIGSRRRRPSRTPPSRSQRSATDTFAGIRPADAPGFVAAELGAVGLATIVFRWFGPSEKPS